MLRQAHDDFIKIVAVGLYAQQMANLTDGDDNARSGNKARDDRVRQEVRQKAHAQQTHTEEEQARECGQ